MLFPIWWGVSHAWIFGHDCPGAKPSGVHTKMQEDSDSDGDKCRLTCVLPGTWHHKSLGVGVLHGRWCSLNVNSRHIPKKIQHNLKLQEEYKTKSNCGHTVRACVPHPCLPVHGLTPSPAPDFAWICNPARLQTSYWDWGHSTLSLSFPILETGMTVAPPCRAVARTKWDDASKVPGTWMLNISYPILSLLLSF